MHSSWKIGVAFLAIVLVAGLMLTLNPVRPALGAADAGVPKHTVVATDGTHLVVTDNGAGKVYFYAIEQGGKPGDEMKLRGSINLNDVGKAAIKPTKEK